MDRDNETPRKRGPRAAHTYRLTVKISEKESNPHALICDAMLKRAAIKNVVRVEMAAAGASACTAEDKSSTAEANCSASSQDGEN